MRNPAALLPVADRLWLLFYSSLALSIDFFYLFTDILNDVLGFAIAAVAMASLRHLWVTPGFEKLRRLLFVCAILVGVVFVPRYIPLLPNFAAVWCVKTARIGGALVMGGVCGLYVIACRESYYKGLSFLWFCCAAAYALSAAHEVVLNALDQFGRSTPSWVWSAHWLVSTGAFVGVGLATFLAAKRKPEPLPRRTCEKCGYALGGLPPAARCSECGHLN